MNYPSKAPPIPTGELSETIGITPFEVTSITFVPNQTTRTVTFSDASTDDVQPSYGPYIDNVSIPAKYVIADIDVDSNNDGSIDVYDDPVEDILFGYIVEKETDFQVYVAPTYNFAMESSRYGARIVSSNQDVVATATGGMLLTLDTGIVTLRSGTTAGTTTLTYEVYEKSTGTVIASDLALVTIGNWVGVDCTKNEVHESSLKGDCTNVIVSLSSAPVETVTVSYVISGTAKYGVDYTLTLPSNVTFVQNDTGGSGTITFDTLSSDSSEALDKTFLVTALQDGLIERLWENITFTISLDSNPGGVYAIAEDHESVEVKIEDMDTLEVDYVGFGGKLSLLPDPESGDWSDGLNWINDKQLSNNSTEGYLPVAYSSDKKLKVDGVRLKGEVDTEIVDHLFVQFEVIINGQVQISSKTKLSKQTYELELLYKGVEPKEPSDGITRWDIGVSSVELEKTFEGIFGRKQAMYKPHFALTWKLCIEDANSEGGEMLEEDADVRVAGVSTSCLYVTYERPIDTVPLYHSVVHIGCVAAANVTTGEEEDVFDAIWSKFQSLNIHEVNIVNGKVVQGELLTYYGKDLLDNTHEVNTTKCLTIEDGLLNQTPSLAREVDLYELLTGAGGGGGVLLSYFDGRCGNWAIFMAEMMRVQGIDASVKNVKSIDGYAFKVDPTIKGQGNVIPRENLWSNHATVIYNDTIYDPSYGVCYGDISIALDNLAKNFISVGTFTSNLRWADASKTILLGSSIYTTDPTINTIAEKRAKILWM